MNLCKIFIHRPVATVVIIVGLTLAGIIAYFHLPISELPNIDFPTIVVSAKLPGADPETMATSVATPLEKKLSTVSGIDSMSSVSSAGSTRITLQFALDRNIDAAAQDVQSAILQATRQLPSQMPDPPSIRKVNPADSSIIYIALTAKHLSMTKLDDYAENAIAPRLSMLEGVAEVNVYGAQQYAVRIHLNPTALKNRGLALDDVMSAVKAVNTNQPTGTLQSYGFYHLIKVDGNLDNAAQFGDAIIASNNGAPIRLKDVARVENSVANDKAITWYNDKQAIVLAIKREPGSNTVAVAKRILTTLPGLVNKLPGNAQLNVVYNRATFIKAAIDDVELTLLFAMLLVTAVIYLFLRKRSFTIIAALSLPISVIATFAVMYLLRYSLNNLSLMGLILAVGFIIDDAIVVLENIVRHVEQGVDRMTASLIGAKEVSFTVIAMTLSLIAVFIPIFFMGGIIGRLFHEFAAVVGIAILFSALVALSLIPMLCSRFVREGSSAKSHSFFQTFFITIKEQYTKSLRWSLDHCTMMLTIAAIIVILTALLLHVIPRGFIPAEDSGMIYGNVKAIEGITYKNFIKEQLTAKKIIEKNPNIAAVIASVGQGADAAASVNSGRLVIKLQPTSKRKLNSAAIIQQLRRQLKPVAGLKIYLTNPPSIRIGGKVSNSHYQYVLQSTDWQTLESAANLMQKKLLALPGIEDVDIDLQLNNPELQLHILRDKAAQMGITPEQIESDLYAAYGQQQVSSILRANGDYEVIIDIDPRYQHTIAALDALYLKSATGNMVPLTALVQVKKGIGPLSVYHYGQLPAITLSFGLTPGYSLGHATKQITQIAAQALPADVSGTFSGEAEKFQQSLKTLPLLLLFTILVIYMVLAILYENFIHPLTILTALPFAIFGALLCLYLFNQTLDIFSFIGLIMLVGITKKNGIIMIDFALAARREKTLSAKEAIVSACSVRFRPIMMTTMAAIVATLPIALGIGAGGEARKALGISVVGGLIFSQFITLYMTPVFYILLDRFKKNY
ncbi:MAG: efflux RND transporter permease subunit [Gammaproteobacteria bacterium]|nr:efflux RND transporter permease subunit [Gammaproteobacteria bacterium]